MNLNPELEQATADLWKIAKAVLHDVMGPEIFYEYEAEMLEHVARMAELQLRMARGESPEMTQITLDYALANQKMFIRIIKGRMGDAASNVVSAVFDVILGVAKVVAEKALTAGIILLLGEVGEYWT